MTSKKIRTLIIALFALLAGFAVAMIANDIKNNQNLLQEEFGFTTSFYLRLDSFKYKAPFFTRLGESFIYSFKISGNILETLG